MSQGMVRLDTVVFYKLDLHAQLALYSDVLLCLARVEGRRCADCSINSGPKLWLLRTHAKLVQWAWPACKNPSMLAPVHFRRHHRDLFVVLAFIAELYSKPYSAPNLVDGNKYTNRSSRQGRASFNATFLAFQSCWTLIHSQLLVKMSTVQRWPLHQHHCVRWIVS